MTDQRTVPRSSTRADRAARPRIGFGHAAVLTPDLDRFRRFYEDVVGLRLAVVERPPGAPFNRLGAFTDPDGDSVVLLAFEVAGYTSGLPDDAIGRRGRVDHLAFQASDAEEFAEVVARLVDAGASAGAVEELGPMRSVLFVDPDGGHRNLQVLVDGWTPDSDVYEVLDADLLTRATGAVLP